MSVALKRLPYLLAVAVVAAAVGDPFVESVSNLGVFGFGYNDNNHLSVIPALIAGLALGIVLLISRCVASLRGAASVRPNWLAEGVSQFAGGPAGYDLAVIVVLQLCALFGMESAERLAFGGGLETGVEWLGGPIAFSLLAHAVIAGALYALFAMFARTVHDAIVRVVRDVVDAILFSIAPGGPRAIAGRDRIAAFVRAQAPRVREIGGRAPPVLPFAA